MHFVVQGRSLGIIARKGSSGTLCINVPYQSTAIRISKAGPHAASPTSTQQTHFEKVFVSDGSEGFVFFHIVRRRMNRQRT